MTVTTEGILRWFEDLARVYAENRAWLTELDSAIGDADHGVNMDRGFAAARTELAARPPADIGAALQTVAGVLIRTVGGASGPLYGTFFLRAAKVCAGKSTLEAADLVAFFQAGVEGVAQRGKSARGEKTMLDALVPAVEAMQAARAAGEDVPGILEKGAAAAETGMAATVPMLARKGRASYLGARSVGHQDPGATSAFLMLRSASTTWRA